MEAKKDSSYNPSPFEMLLDDIIQHKGNFWVPKLDF